MFFLPDVFAVTDFRQNTARHIRRLKGADKPTLLTQNGRTAAVVMSQALYDRLAAEAELGRSVAGIRESLGDPRSDIPLERVAARLRARYSGGRARRSVRPRGSRE